MTTCWRRSLGGVLCGGSMLLVTFLGAGFCGGSMFQKF